MFAIQFYYHIECTCAISCSSRHSYSHNAHSLIEWREQKKAKSNVNMSKTKRQQQQQNNGKSIAYDWVQFQVCWRACFFFLCIFHSLLVGLVCVRVFVGFSMMVFSIYCVFCFRLLLLSSVFNFILFVFLNHRHIQQSEGWRRLPSFLILIFVFIVRARFLNALCTCFCGNGHFGVSIKLQKKKMYS